MPTQYVFGSANDRYKKKLFVDTGFTFVEVKARIIEPYTPPTPQPTMKEIKIINAPSHIHHMGLSSYKATVTLLFNDKESYSEYLVYAGWTHKLYDEKGQMFVGSVESVKPEAKQASTRYVVTLELVMVKKDGYDQKHKFQFQDLEDQGGNDHWAKPDIEEMADLGLVTVISNDGQPVIYFRPNDYITRAEFVCFLNRTRRLVERIIRE
jgi:hypothetical protein